MSADRDPAELAATAAAAVPPTQLGATAPGGPPAATPLGRGDAIDRFVVLDRLGAGGMGVVVSAYDPDLDRKVAIKVLRAGGADAGGEREQRLVREAQALAKLADPHVITVHQVGVVRGHVFVAMEYVDGGTLTGWVAAQKRPWREVLAAFIDAGRGLAAAHAAGLVHRDFKPDNVLVGVDGRVRVTDFGLVGRTGGAEPVDPAAPTPDQEPATPLTASLTTTGTVMGTPLYMAPEQHLGKPPDPRADQFSFCVALYEALYGEHPFGGDTIGELRARVLAGELRPAPAGAAVPAPLRRLLVRGLSVDPAERFASMNELLAGLRRDPAAARRRWLAGGALLAVALAAVGAIRWAGARRDELCRGAERQLAGVWDGELAARGRAAFAATDAPYAADTWTRAAAALDRAAAAWATMHRDACAATRLRGEQSEAVLDLRMRCLARRREQLRTLALLFAAADRSTVDNAVTAAAGQVDLGECADLEALNAVVPPPRDPAVRAAVDRVERVLAAGSALRDAGRHQEALLLARPTVLMARATGHGPLLARALLGHGMSAETSGRSEEAAAQLQASVLEADAARDEGARADALIALVLVVGLRLNQPEAGMRWAQRADAVLRRSGDPATDRSDLLSHVGAVHFAAQRYREAAEASRGSIALRERIAGPDSLELAPTLGNLGMALARLGRWEEAIAMWDPLESTCRHASLSIL